jgi:hypothetical protein
LTDRLIVVHCNVDQLSSKEQKGVAMRNHKFLIGFLSISCVLALGIGSAVFALDMNLVSVLTKNLGVSTQQAEGGAGAIFNAASQNMSVDDFAKVTHALPDIQSLMKAAPSMDTGAGTLGGLSSMLGKSGGVFLHLQA